MSTSNIIANKSDLINTKILGIKKIPLFVRDLSQFL